MEASTPCDHSMKLIENSDKIVTQLEYAIAIRNIMYIAYCIRLDIAFALCKLSRYISKPSYYH